MKYSRFCEGHRRLDRFVRCIIPMEVEAFQYDGLPAFEALLSDEMSRWCNSGEIDHIEPLDGIIGLLRGEYEAKYPPFKQWYRTRSSYRLTDNTTPPMFVLRFRAHQVWETLSEKVGNREPDPIISFREVIGDGSAAKMYLDDPDPNPLSYALQMGLLPYEAAYALSTQAIVSALPRAIRDEEGFLLRELETLFQP